MNEKEKQRLKSAYLQTNYVAEDKNERIVIRVGEHNSALDKLLESYGIKTWAFVTAYNPFSELLTEKENQIRQKNLVEQLKKNNFRFLNGYGKGADENWQAEPSVLVFAIALDEAISISRKFGQNAIVFGETGKAPQLVWC